MTTAHAKTAPREPLGFTDAGLYGGWSEYAVSEDSPFDYLIVQAIVLEDHIEWNGYDPSDGKTWNEWLQRARANGKRVIADVVPAAYDENGDIQSIQSFYHFQPPLPLETFLPLFDKFFNEVDEQELYAITLSEEHVHWNGQAEHLNQMYDYVKERYDVPVFQWYTPAAWVPGFSEWPNLRADGWVSDEYFLKQPEMEQYVRGFVLQRKPFVHIIWAAPDCASVPWNPTVFADQLAVCRKYDIAPSYFTWAGSGSVWGWQEDSPSQTRAVFEEYCVVSAAQDEQDLSVLDTAQWDLSPTPPKWITLRCDPESRPVMDYRDDFAKASHVKFLNEATLTGFADLKWDSSPLQFCPRKAGPATSSATWRFESPLPMRALRVTLPGREMPGKSANILLQVNNETDRQLAATKLNDAGVCEIVLSEPLEKRFLVTATITGEAKAANEILAEIDGLIVEADIAATNQAKPILLDANPSGGVAYHDDFRNLTILHTAHNIVRRTAMTLQPGWLYCTGRDDMNSGVEIIQMFRTTKPIRLDELWVKGMGNIPQHRSRFGVALSLDGTNKIAEAWSEGKLDGEVKLDTTDIAESKSGLTEFFVHLRLDADGKKTLPERCGVRAYGLHGRLIGVE